MMAALRHNPLAAADHFLACSKGVASVWVARDHNSRAGWALVERVRMAHGQCQRRVRGSTRQTRSLGRCLRASRFVRELVYVSTWREEGVLEREPQLSLQEGALNREVVRFAVHSAVLVVCR